MADVYGVLQIEVRGQRRKIVGIMIHVMPSASLCGSSMAATIMGYDPIALIEEEEQLCVPVIRRKRPAVTEHDGLTLAPVLVINLHSIFRCDRTHLLFSLY